MSKRTILKYGETRYPSGSALRAEKSIMVSHKFVADKFLMPGQRVTLSIKAGARRRLFSGFLMANMPSCTCHTGVEFYSIEK